jgi:hypothetical protein
MTEVGQLFWGMIRTTLTTTMATIKWTVATTATITMTTTKWMNIATIQASNNNNNNGDGNDGNHDEDDGIGRDEDESIINNNEKTRMATMNRTAATAMAALMAT